MLFASEHITQASGSIGGVTYAHNKGGMYRRARAIPVNPNTSFQNQVRNALTDLITSWGTILTAAQRTAWRDYAANTPTTNALGATINLSGQNWYVACNTPREQAMTKMLSTIARIDDAPTIFDRGDFTTPVFVCTEAVGLAWTIDNADPWANEDGAAMFVYQGRPMNASRNFFNGPWRLVAAVEGDSVTPPANSQSVSNADLAVDGFTFTAGQNTSVAFSVTRADARLTSRRPVGPQLAVV